MIQTTTSAGIAQNPLLVVSAELYFLLMAWKYIAELFFVF